MKIDCPNPRQARAFAGTCRHCSKDGHRAAECPEKPEQACKNCKVAGEYCEKCISNNYMLIFIGHFAKDCTLPRKIDLSGVDVKSPDEAWDNLLAADKTRDLDDIREVGTADKDSKVLIALTRSTGDQSLYQSHPGYILCTAGGCVPPLQDEHALDRLCELSRPYRERQDAHGYSFVGEGSW